MAKMSEKEREVKRKEALHLMETMFSDEFALYIRDVVRKFEGQFPVLESAIGALILGRLLGWRVLYLMHSRKTMNTYQRHLGLDFRGKCPWDDSQDVMPEVGPFAQISMGYVIAEKMGEYWDIIKGIKSIPREKKEVIKGAF